MSSTDSSLQQVLEQGYADARVRVRYAETDQMGVVYHANYLVWFEVGRVELMRQIGLDYKNMERDEGAMVAVVEATARYKAPARYDDELIVRTRVSAAKLAILKFKYEVLRAADGTVLCEGETVHLVVGRDMKRRSLPAKYVELFGDLVLRMVKS
jgi:acyl-CoA thioester hydrolase